MPMRKCLIFSINRNLGKFRRGKYEGVKGFYTRFFFLKGESFAIPKNIKPIDLDISKPFRRNRRIAVFGVDEISHIAFDLTQEEKISDKLIAQLVAFLKMFSEATFYQSMSERLKLTLSETLIYLGCGMGLGLLIDRILVAVIH